MWRLPECLSFAAVAHRARSKELPARTPNKWLSLREGERDASEPCADLDDPPFRIEEQSAELEPSDSASLRVLWQKRSGRKEWSSNSNTPHVSVTPRFRQTIWRRSQVCSGPSCRLFLPASSPACSTISEKRCNSFNLAYFPATSRARYPIRARRAGLERSSRIAPATAAGSSGLAASPQPDSTTIRAASLDGDATTRTGRPIARIE